ncbi:MAG TPA: phenylacetate--CoA ligase family protein [Myxococcales bacterium]|nr:phenylacetate--CoA ligase family protein [Myxococcales bacterium]HIN85668.1 phenylacetate--CoA ligase family protein [Myxococcales bacterium]
MRKTFLKQLVMPGAAAVSPFKSWRYMKEICELEFEPLQRQRMQRMALLRELLVHSYRETDLYRSKLDEAGVNPIEVSYPRTFAKVPITGKEDLRKGFPDRQLARSHLTKWLRYSNTSGTTGRPLLLVQDVIDISYKYASILRSRVLAGIDPLSSQLRLTPNECQPCLPTGDSPEGTSPFGSERSSPSRRSSIFLFLEKQVVNPLFHKRQMLEPFWNGPADNRPVDYDGYLKKINAAEPEIFTVYPVYAMLLAKHLRRTGASPPNLAGIIDFSGGLCTPRMREFISEVFGARTAQGCGGCEFARYGASCPQDPDRMHLAESYCYVETVRNDDTLCSPGEIGNVVVTSLHSRAMPIIRLEPGDIGRIFEEPCSCGRRSRRLEHAGRIHSLIRNADGRWVTALESWDKLFFIEGLEIFQLVQKDEQNYRLRLVPEPGKKVNKVQLDETLEALLGAGAKVQLETVGNLQSERSGKLQLVKSNTYSDFRSSAIREQKVPIN